MRLRWHDIIWLGHRTWILNYSHLYTILSFIELDKAVVHVITHWFSVIMVSLCLPSDALLQNLPSYLGFSYLGWGVSPHSHHSWPWTWSSSSGPPAPMQLPLLGCGVAPLSRHHWPLAWDWKRWVFIPIPKEGSAKECSNYCTIALISHASKVILKILQARLQQHVNRELSDVQAGFRKGRGTRDQIANIRWIIKKARESQKNIYFCFIDYAKAFDCVDHNKLWKILKKMGIPDHLTCLLRNQYAGQEATVRTGHGTTDWFQIGKGVGQGCILSPCLFNLYADNIIRNAGLEETQAGIKIARRNNNNLRYHPYGRKWRGTKKSLDESERGEWKSWLKAQNSEN